MSWLPILVGAQGVGKSMFAHNLVPDALFSRDHHATGDPDERAVQASRCLAVGAT